MIPRFQVGEHVYFTHQVAAKGIAAKSAGTTYVNQGAKGVVAGYSREGTPDEPGDDFVGVKITEGDQAVGKTVWVPYDEFGKLNRI